MLCLKFQMFQFPLVCYILTFLQHWLETPVYALQYLNVYNKENVQRYLDVFGMLMWSDLYKLIYMESTGTLQIP